MRNYPFVVTKTLKCMHLCSKIMAKVDEFSITWVLIPYYQLSILIDVISLSNKCAVFFCFVFLLFSLVQWLKYSRKEYCELCKHRFSFTPSKWVYSLHNFVLLSDI